MARRVSQRERTQEAHPDEAPLTKRQQLEEKRNDAVHVNKKPKFAVFFFHS